jgi:hypothetical protein
MNATAADCSGERLQGNTSREEPSPTDKLSAELTSIESGQFALRHILGLTTVVAIVLGFSASRLRAMTAVEAAQVGIHWLYVLTIAAGGYLAQSYWRRKTGGPAGPLLLRVWQYSATPSRRRWIRWLLTAAVIADGIFISFAVGPGQKFSEVLNTSWIISVLIQLPMMEGGLWLAWIRNWLTDVNVLEFRQNGLLLSSHQHVFFFPWKSMTRAYWSSLRGNTLVIFTGGSVMNLSIPPGARAAVSNLLERLPPCSEPPAARPAGKPAL